jgi:hypothetical protein
VRGLRGAGAAGFAGQLRIAPDDKADAACIKSGTNRDQAEGVASVKVDRGGLPLEEA